jgi:hypothetical protein
MATTNDYAGEAAQNRQWTVPSQTYELTDADQCITEVTFANANYYRAYLVLLALPDNYSNPSAREWTLRLRGTELGSVNQEFASAADSEANFVSYLTDTYYLAEVYQPWPEPASGWDADPPTGRPLCGVVLKNNGTVGVAGQFLPIDRVNRGRSYLFMDVRPRWLSA